MKNLFLCVDIGQSRLKIAVYDANLKLKLSDSISLKTIEKIIHRWAPPIENDTDNYIQYVCAATSKAKDEELANSIEDYLPLVKAIIRMENGDQPYDDEVISEGMLKAWEGHPTT